MDGGLCPGTGSAAGEFSIEAVRRRMRDQSAGRADVPELLESEGMMPRDKCICGSRQHKVEDRVCSQAIIAAGPLAYVRPEPTPPAGDRTEREYHLERALAQLDQWNHVEGGHGPEPEHLRERCETLIDIIRGLVESPQ